MARVIQSACQPFCSISDVSKNDVLREQKVLQAMRVLHIVGNLDGNSGVMSVIMSYYRFLNSAEFQFDFLYFYETDQSYEEEILNLGGQCCKLEAPSVQTMPAFFRAVNHFFEREAHRYQAIHYHAVSPGVFCLKAAKKHGIEKIIIHSHNTRYADYCIRAIRNGLLTKATLRYGTHACACSQEAAKFLFGSRAVAEKKVLVLENAFEHAQFQYSPDLRDEVRAKLRLNDKFVVGHVGRLEKQKNHIFILKVFAEIKKLKENAVLVLVGDGELRPELEKKAAELKIERHVLFLGTRKDVAAILQGMDVFLFPSLFEGLGIAVVEAQISGLPCVASDVLPEETRITSHIAFLSLKKSAKEWAEKALNFCSGCDRKRIDTDRFRIETAVSKLMELYRS